MRLIINKQESIRAIENYLSPQKKKDWGLLIHRDKTLRVTHLSYQKFSFFTRLLALFGFGKGSFRNVIRFCHRAELAEQLKEGNLKALNSKIEAYAKKHPCFKIQRLVCAVKAPPQTPPPLPVNGEVLQQEIVKRCAPGLLQKTVLKKLRVLPWIVATPRGLSIRIPDNSRLVVAGITPQEKKDLQGLDNRLQTFLSENKISFRQKEKILFRGKIYKELLVPKEDFSVFAKALSLDQEVSDQLKNDPIFKWLLPKITAGSDSLTSLAKALSSFEGDPDLNSVSVESKDFHLLLKIPEQKGELKEKLEALFMLNEEAGLLQVPEDRVASLFEELGLSNEFKNLKTRRPQKKEAFFRAVEGALKPYNVKLTWHPRGWLVIGLANRSPELEKKLHGVAELLILPGPQYELIIVGEKLPEFLKKLQLENVADLSISSFPTLQIFEAEFGEKYNLDVFGAIARTMASIDPEIRKILQKTKPLEEPPPDLLPKVTWEEDRNRLSIFIEQPLAEREICWGGQKISFGDYFGNLFTPSTRNGKAWEIFVPFFKFQQFLERDLGLREFQGPSAKEYKKRSRQTTYFGHFHLQVKGKPMDSGSINADNLALCNKEQKVEYTLEESLKIIKALVASDEIINKYSYLHRRFSQAGYEDHRDYLFLILEKFQDISISKEKRVQFVLSVLSEVGTFSSIPSSRDLLSKLKDAYTSLIKYSLEEALDLIKNLVGSDDDIINKYSYLYSNLSLDAYKKHQEYFFLVLGKFQDISIPKEQRVQFVLSIADECVEKKEDYFHRTGFQLICSEGMLSKLQGAYASLTCVADDVKTICLTEVEAYKEELLKASSLKGGLLYIENWQVHIANAMKLKLKGFSLKAARADHYAHKSDRNSVYLHFNIKNCVKHFKETYLQSAPNLIAAVYNALSTQRDGDQLRYAALYSDALGQFFMKQGIFGKEREEKVAELLPIGNNGIVSLTEGAVKAMLTHIGILNP